MTDAPKPPAKEQPRPDKFCPACGAPPFIPHNEDCPWLAYLPESWLAPRVEPVSA